MQITPTVPECACCLEGIAPKTKRILACKHEFHSTCIENWINSSVHQQESEFHKPKEAPGCPLCKRTIEPLDSQRAIRPALRIIVPPPVAQYNRDAALAALMLPASALRFIPQPRVEEVAAQAPAQQINNRAKPSLLEFLASLIGKVSR